MPISFCTFNVLAPVWAQASFYPNDSCLDWSTRFQAISQILCKGDYDLIALQEVTDDYCDKRGTFSELKKLLEHRYFARFVPNDIDYWSCDYLPDPTSPHAKILHGCAVFIKNELSVKSIETIEFVTGNRGIWIDLDADCQLAIVHLNYSLYCYKCHPTCQTICCVELDYLLDWTDRNLCEKDQIVLGDFNSDLQGLNLRGFQSVIQESKNTIPHSSLKWSDNLVAVTDHIIHRGNKLCVSAQVVDFNLLEIGDEEERIRETLKTVGSDHFPLVGNYIEKI